MNSVSVVTYSGVSLVFPANQASRIQNHLQHSKNIVQWPKAENIPSKEIKDDYHMPCAFPPFFRGAWLIYVALGQKRLVTKNISNICCERRSEVCQGSQVQFVAMNFDKGCQAVNRGNVFIRETMSSGTQQWLKCKQ